MAEIEDKLATILRQSGWRCVGPNDAGRPLDERQLGEDIQAAFNDIDHLAFGDTFEEATERCREAGKYLLRFYQIAPK